jgi:hypothetical protein
MICRAKLTSARTSLTLQVKGDNLEVEYSLGNSMLTAAGGVETSDVKNNGTK